MRPPLGALSKYAAGLRVPADWAALVQLLTEQAERPVLLPFSAGSQSLLAKNRDITPHGDFLLADTDVLDATNDKAYVAERAGALGIPVPRRYTRETTAFPCVVKPVCGEKYGLAAAECYRIVHTEAQPDAALAAFADCGPLVLQEYVVGDAVGVSVLMDEAGQPLSFLCHKRLRQRPVTGGPSTACVSIYDRPLLDYAVNFHVLQLALKFVEIFSA